MSQPKQPPPPRPRPQFFSWPVEGNADGVEGIVAGDLVKGVIPCLRAEGGYGIIVEAVGVKSICLEGFTAEQAKKFVQTMLAFLTGYDFLPGLTVGLDLVEKNAKTSELELQKPPLVVVPDLP